ncbi:hypothetical protein R1flu_024362 [Riccia fluitans]|uniref:Uncharacterized protein n=1 Tax=Riccia fluitans TaxID=41844 RepID=A0ABD1XV41_9MARC
MPGAERNSRKIASRDMVLKAFRMSICKTIQSGWKSKVARRPCTIISQPPRVATANCHGSKCAANTSQNWRDMERATRQYNVSPTAVGRIPLNLFPKQATETLQVYEQLVTAGARELCGNTAERGGQNR